MVTDDFLCLQVCGDDEKRSKSVALVVDLSQRKEILKR